MIMRKESLVTGPTEKPVTRAEQKDHAGIPSADTTHDTYIDRLIAAATDTAEKITNRKFITQTWDLFFDMFPYSADIELPYPKTQSLTWVKYYDPDGTQRTLESTYYQEDFHGIVGLIALAPDQNKWPDTQLRKRNAVNIRYVAGYGNAEAVPDAIKQAIMILAQTWFENREEVVMGAMPAIVPRTVDRLLADYRVRSFA